MYDPNRTFGEPADHDYIIYRLRVQFRNGGSLIENIYVNEDDLFWKHWKYYAREDTPALIEWAEYDLQHVRVMKGAIGRAERFTLKDPDKTWQNL